MYSNRARLHARLRLSTVRTVARPGHRPPGAARRNGGACSVPLPDRRLPSIASVYPVRSGPVETINTRYTAIHDHTHIYAYIEVPHTRRTDTLASRPMYAAVWTGSRVLFDNDMLLNELPESVVGDEQSTRR